MRIFSPALAFGALLLTGLPTSTFFAQGPQQLAAASPQSAPGQTRHPANPQRKAGKMTRKLGLTADQEAKIEPILADRQQQVQSTKLDSTLAQKDKHARVRSIRRASDAKIEAILTDPQKQQYQQMKQSHKAAKLQQCGAFENS